MVMLGVVVLVKVVRGRCCAGECWPKSGGAIPPSPSAAMPDMAGGCDSASHFPFPAPFCLVCLDFDVVGRYPGQPFVPMGWNWRHKQH